MVARLWIELLGLRKFLVLEEFDTFSPLQLRDGERSKPIVLFKDYSCDGLRPRERPRPHGESVGALGDFSEQDRSGFFGILGRRDVQGMDIGGFLFEIGFFGQIDPSWARTGVFRIVVGHGSLGALKRVKD